MAESLGSLLSFPPEQGVSIGAKEYDSKIVAYIKQLNQIPSAQWSSAVDKKNILDVLDPSINSLPYLYALNAQASEDVDQDGDRLVAWVGHATNFLQSFDPVQLRYEGGQWYKFLHTVLRIHETQGTQNVDAVISAILRLDPTAGTFTVWHSRIVKLCLAAGIPSQALPILDNNIFAFPQDHVKYASEDVVSDPTNLSNAYITAKSGFTSRINSEMVLEYYVLGAQIYLGLGNLDRARLFLEYILLSPGVQHAVSALQVEAYKKWILTGLLSEGQSFPLPKTISPSIVKAVRASSKAYDSLAESANKRDWKKFQAEVDRGNDIWNDDGNAKLVRKASDALLHFSVNDLSKTFVALPVSRVAAHLDLPVDATLQILASMVSAGSLQADVGGQGASAVVRFRAKDTQDDGLASTEAQTERIKTLAVYIQDADRRLQLTKEYIDNQKRQKLFSGPDGDPADAMDLSYDAPTMADDDVGDEDIME
ncbi:CSN3 COP9 constitutive [Dissoconium aciculare CBS 342.82]|uniref:COP9 signalosome complex subunit 3 n=1 Tax=Dissoconium aciculare CBS 342.82 TaxID=1314786 RepID=A0A6J3LY32_9PEZI|nr:CSN3 COP9 constitutive [Dissoconium aciculare CBS 342.82]KAF1820670.1 CSN3 COP9 constitutive [Dissoconium aciculare CBS 342.82]